MGHKRTLSRWLLLGEWQAHKVQAATAIISIALGVALGYAIHLINAAAFNEFSAAARSLSGQSDLQVRSAQSTFDESIYPLLARHTVSSSPTPCWKSTPPSREAMKSERGPR